MVKIEAFIFDLDGVLVDTAKYHYLAWRKLANELGFDFSKEENEQLKGIERMQSLEILLKIGGLDFSKEKKQQLAAQKNKYYLIFISKMTTNEVLPGVREFLDEAKSEGFKMALGSASKNAGAILRKTDLERYFDAIIDGNKIKNAKPDPEIFLKGAGAVDVQPSKCLVFEDAAAGIQAAINAGMRSAGIGDPATLSAANVVVPGFVGLTVYDLLKLVY
ncbi:Beta-phosphoglucomutase [hydrothermal vent metagenome]|uniref:Beta-phosphoglucomutase n=1 Tax=hydrothermal vent metagenome TaxID=652676 RepID=A0A3B0U7A5_9ZZZZ